MSGSFKTGWHRAGDTAGMSEDAFTPALGRLAPARFFDYVVALTRERLWRGLTVKHLAPQPGDAILDVGCGTGSLALLAARAQPQATVVGLDPDPEVLAVARDKDTQGRVRWLTGMGDALVDAVGAESMDAVMSSLVLHQCPVPVKRAVLASMFAVLRPGGRLVIADYGLQRTRLMRTAFRIVQIADGKTDTQPNADGVLPELISNAGFADVREAEVVPTITGSISIYVTGKR
ncbi:hypothetical protein MTER_26000 [Mycolicibacter terrae]|uniref:Methyltransferase domain-containing protein n=2 Tax=Mycolicibacter terrae TaxID=1788 RepID=A0AAD1MIM3_9MYCO|nr:hypothetical protein MTER_26000 [Mycolicibacter terrae]SNV66712.1 methyltransferase [Mycolicibacter terrae]